MTGYTLGHTPPPLKRFGASTDSPFHQYAGTPVDPVLANALNASRPELETVRTGLRFPAYSLPPVAVRRPALDGLLHPDDEDRLRYWQSDVRVLLVVSELVPLFSFVAPSGGLNAGDPVSPAKVFINLPTPFDVAHVTRPSAATLLQGPQGISSVFTAAPARIARRNEILSQVGAMDVFFAAILGIHPERHPMTMELMEIVSRIVAVPIQWLKHHCCAPRPVELSADVQPMILTPGHGSYPGGHAAYAFALAIVLSILTYADVNATARLMSIAERIAQNRVIAGLHFDCDTEAGKALGLTFGLLLAILGTTGSGQTTWQPLNINGATGAVTPLSAPAVTTTSITPAIATSHAPKFAWLWARAAAEWV